MRDLKHCYKMEEFDNRKTREWREEKRKGGGVRKENGEQINDGAKELEGEEKRKIKGGRERERGGRVSEGAEVDIQ